MVAVDAPLDIGAGRAARPVSQGLQGAHAAGPTRALLVVRHQLHAHPRRGGGDTRYREQGGCACPSGQPPLPIYENVSELISNARCAGMLTAHFTVPSKASTETAKDEGPQAARMVPGGIPGQVHAEP